MNELEERHFNCAQCGAPETLLARPGGENPGWLCVGCSANQWFSELEFPLSKLILNK